MAPSIDDDVASSLLCVDESSIVFDDDNNDFSGDEVNTLDNLNHRNSLHNQSYDEVLLPLLSEEFLGFMLKTECQHLPVADDYLKKFQSGNLDLDARNQAVDWIEKVKEHCGFGPLCAYLAVNYMDRFLSACRIPRDETWTMQLLAVACVSLAAKVEETEVPLSLDLQVVGSKLVFQAATLQKMEMIVLRTLKYRMQAITPFSFIDHFICKINDDQFPPPRSPLLQSLQLISATTKGIDFLEHKPSEIAAAAAILALKESQTVDTEKAVSVLSQYVEKGNVLKCIEMIRGVAFDGGSNMGPNNVVSTEPRSPIGVLDVASHSFKSDNSAVESGESSTPQFKRGKFN